MASNNFFSSLSKKVKEQIEENEKKVKEQLGGSNTSSNKSNSSESKGLQKNGSSGLSQSVTTSSGSNNNITRSIGNGTSGTTGTNKQKSSTITNADKLLSGVKSGISTAAKTATTSNTKQANNKASSTLKKNTMASVNSGITSGFKKTSASKVDQLLNPTNKTKTKTAEFMGTGVLEDLDNDDDIQTIMDVNKKKAEANKSNTAKNNLLALFNLGYANERIQNAIGNLGSWFGGKTKEVENATEYGMARKDIQARETAKELELNNALKADIKDLSEGQRQIRRDYLNQNNNEIDLKIQETKEKLEELNRTTEKVSSLNNYLYTDEYESQLESALGDEYGRYLLENEIDERDLPLSQYQGIWAENRTNEYENLQNTIQGYEMQKKNNQADLDELDYYDKLGTKYGAMVNQEKRKEYISKLEEENAQLQAEFDLADQYVKDFTEGKESIYKDEKEVWEANQENINKKLKISENQKEIDDLRKTFGILDDDIEDDASYHEEYYGGFNRYYNPNKDRNGTGPQYDTNDINRIVSFINDGEEYEMWSARNGVGLKAYITGDYSGAGAMLDSEREQLTKLYNAAMAEGREPVEAQAFFTALQPTLNARLRVYEELSNRVTARTFPILSTLGSVAASATQLPLAIMTAYGAATGADWAEDPNGWLGANTRMQRDIESQVAEDLGPVGGFVYKGAVSGAKNFLRGIMYGPLGGNAAEIGTLAQFFGEAFYQNYFDELENTHDVAGSALKSLLNAGVSTITEIVSVEKMYGDATNFWQYFLQNVSAEMGEEGEEAILSPLLNRLFFGTDEIEEKSLDYFRQMQEQGYFTDKDGNKIKLTDETIGQASYMAWEQATKGYINENVEGMLIAGLSAGGSSMVGAFNNLAENKRQNKQAGETALTHGIEAGQENTEEGKDTYYANARKILEAGKSMPAGSQSQKLAAELTSEIREGNGINKEKFGQLVKTILSETDNKITGVARDVLWDNIKADLKDKGIGDQTAYRIASIITKKVVGEELTDQEKFDLYQSEEGKAIALEYGVGLKSGMATTFDMGRVSKAANDILEKTKTESEASKSVWELLTEPKENVTADAVKKIVAGATVAAKEDIKNAEGQRTGNKGETVSEGKIADIAGIALKQVDVEVEGEDGKPKTEQQTRWQVTMSDGREVDIADVKAVDQDVAEALTFLQNDSGKVIGQNLADAVIKIATTKKTGGNMATTLSGAVRIMWAAATEQATPKISGMSAADTAAITDAVKADLEESEKKRTAAFTVLAAGKGTTTLNGVAYGTNAFNEMVNKVVRDNNLGDNVKTEAQVIGSIAKSVGAQVELYYDAEDTANQGMFTAGGGIRINLAGTTNKEGAHRSALATFAHEVTHNIEANSPDAYKALRSFVFTSLGGKLNIQSELSRIQAAYAHYGENLDIAGAVSELVAKACETVLTDESVIRQLQEQDADLAGTVGDAVNELVDRVQSIRGDALTSASMYARAMWDVSRGLSQAWMGAYREAAAATGTTTAEGKAQNAFREIAIDPESIRKNQIEVSQMEAIKADNSKLLSMGTNLFKRVRALFKAPNNIVQSKVFGSVEFSNKKISESFGHGMTPLKAATYALLPEVIGQGNVISYVEKFEDDNFDSAIVAAPVEITDGKLKGEYYIGAVIKLFKDGSNKYYTHDGIVAIKNMSDGTTTVFDPDSTSSVTKKQEYTGSNKGGNHRTIESVLEELPKRNGKSGNLKNSKANLGKVQNSISDEAYMDAVRAGNMDEAQRIVDETAKKNGFTETVYHGTPTGGFTVFKDWSYFTKNRDYAARYQHASASSIRGSYDTTNPMIYELYMNPGKVFDTRKPAHAKIYNQMRMEYGLDELGNTSSGLPDWTAGRDIAEFIEENGLDFDTFLLDEGADGGYGEEVVSRGISYVTRSNRVKSAEAVTRDNNDEIIPPSERFKVKEPDIRFSMQDPVEINKDGLIAVHNLTRQNLYDTLQEGGFTAPSIAVIWASMGHTKYGEISVVFKPQSIDPRKSVRNKVYGTDAWTPTRGNAQIETKLNYKVIQNVRDQIEQLLSGEDVNEFTNDALNWINHWLYEDQTTDTMDEIIRKAYNNDGMMIAYEKANGREIEKKTTFEKNHSELKHESIGLYNGFLNHLEELGMLQEFMNDMANETGFTILEKYTDIFGESSEEEKKYADAYKKDPESRLNRNLVYNKMKQARWFQEDGREIKTYNKYSPQETAESIRDNLNKSDFDNWIRGMMEGALGKKGVYNGKDLFTSSGSRRSFEATHDEPTAENIVRAMYRNHSAKGGEAGGATGLMAKASKEYRSLKEVRADASRLQTIDEEEYRNLVHELDLKLNDFAKRISENSELDYYSIKQELIDAGEVYAKQGTAESIRRYLAKQGIKLDADQIIEAKAIMDEAQNMPTGYFEAKPETVVGFDEIDKVIMPADSELERMLADRNIPYVVTDGTEEDRLEKLNERQEAKFSIQDEMDYDVQSWMETVPEWSLKTEAEKTLLQDFKSLRMKMQLDRERESQTQADIKKLEELLAGPTEGSVTRPETMENALEAAGVEIRPADPKKVLSNPTLIKNGKVIGFIYGNDRVRVSNKADPAIFEEMGFAVDRKTKMATYVNPEGNQMGNTATKKKLEALKVKLQNIRNTQEKTREKLAQITGNEGFGGMMYRQQQVLNDLLYNKTQGEVQDSVERMQARADAVARTIEQNQKTIAEMEKGGIVQKLKEILGTTTAEQAVRELKQMTNSTWTRNEITPLFNEIVLKMTQGQDYQQEIENLAGILVNSSKDNAALDEDLSALRGMTLVISEGQLKELKGQGSSLKEIRQRLAGTGITVKTGEYSSLTDNLDDTIAEYGPALFQDLGDEKDALENFVTRVEQRRNDAIISNQYAERLADTMAQIAAKAAGVAQGIYMPSDRTAQKQVLAMMEYVKGLAAQTQQAQKTLQGIADDMAAIQKEGRQASGMAGALARDVNVALDYYSRINQVAQQSARNQRQQAIIEQLKSKQAEKILKNNEEWRQLIARDAQARKQTEENAKTRGKINTVVRRMYNLLKNPKGNTNIPESMQGIARTVLESIVGNDLGGMKLTRVAAKDLAEISRVLRAWTERDGAPTMPTAGETSDDASLEIIEQDVQKIRDGISQYNADIRGANKVETLQQRGEILKGIQEALSEIYTRIRTENEVFVRGRQVQVANAAHDVVEGTEGKNYQEWSGLFGRKLAALHKMIVSGNMTPEYFFRTLANNGLTALWGNYHDAENRNGLELAKSKARMAEIAEEYGYNTWDMKTRQTVKLASGNVQMTLGQIMSLWATWNREQQLGPEMSSHLTSGGFYTEEQDLRDGLLGRTAVQKKAHRVTEEDMANVESMLTQEQKDFVNAVVRYMSQDMSELGNEASMAAYGIKMYKENYYFPMQMWDGIKSRKSNDAAQGANVDRAFHPSFSKSRTHGANNALVIGDFMQVATDHIAGMINYATMGLANESLQKVLNYTLTEGENKEEATKRNVRARLEEAYGQEAIKYLLELQKQLNGGAVRIEKTIYDKLISTFRKNAVAGSLSVALQQPMSYVRAAMLINPKYLAAALSPTNWKGSYKEMMQYSGVAVIKEMGRFDMNAGQSAREYLMPDGQESTGRKAWNKFQEGVTILPELMDRMTWTRMWSAVKAEQKAQHPEMSATSEEFLTMCGERFNDVMRRTQVYDSVLVKSANMRNQNPFIKSMTSFMAEPTLTLNVLADAVRAAKTGEKGGKGLLVKAGATFMLSAVLQAAIKGLMGSGRNPDDKKTWEENFLYRFFSSFISEADPLQLIPGFSDLITLLKEGKLEDDAMSTIGKFMTAYNKTMDVIGGKNSKGWWRDLEDSAGQLIQLFSKVPMKNLMRDGRAMYNWVTQPYADRETSGNVIGNQTMELIMNADNFVGVVNKWLGDAGYKTDNATYKKRVYEAMRDGNDTAAQNYIDYLLNGKGLKSEKSIMTGQNGVTSYVMDDYQAGNITRTKADELLKIANPNMKDQDRAKKLDEVDYEAKTGEEAENFSLYTPLYDAMDQGNTSEIEAQKKHLAEVGVKESTISKNMKTHIRNQYEEGAITRKQAEEQYRKYAPGISEKDLAETLDEIDYEKETGKDIEKYSLYTRIYGAIDKGDAATIKSQKSYLKTLGIEEKSVNSQIASYISSQYKEGKMKKADAESKLKNYAGKDTNDIFWMLDRIDYTKQTGKKVDSSEKYYRLYDAMDANNSSSIQSAVKTITSHGTYESDVKKTINGHYKQLYLNGSESQKVAIQDAMQKAYKALGYTEKTANKTISNWKKGK